MGSWLDVWFDAAVADIRREAASAGLTPGGRAPKRRDSKAFALYGELNGVRGLGGIDQVRLERLGMALDVVRAAVAEDDRYRIVADRFRRPATITRRRV